MRLAERWLARRVVLPAGAAAIISAAAWAAWAQWGIVEARLIERTSRYGHGVLGDNEFAEMEVGFLFGSDVVDYQHIRLPEDRVFEDFEARITDLTKEEDLPDDKPPHIVVVESSQQGGAELVVYGLVEEVEPAPGRKDGPPVRVRGKLKKIASTPPIGRPFRWLAVAGIADFDGDGQNDVAYVETPHIGGILKIWTMREGALVQIAEASGVSNHRIGEAFISGGVRDCGDGPELVLAMADWSRLVRAWMVDGALEIEAISRSVRPDVWARAMECEL